MILQRNGKKFAVDFDGHQRDFSWPSLQNQAEHPALDILKE